ncbi:NAD(P)-binding protein [Eremomyces bilateralis CBS 781.70]|uniref:NAD(P)-binding protein n=1 Tax=Eremomyces bilateralis CBS 781.70 TaxID=1392243 RepID=A0A6G1GGR0_9PEZI|nr:NAD(P)-binding protein [Eremomyces bilateralis CBS 781.70]KAF1817091.1 NAD(P)-binding protein [Eremomyces bilateralis CBS 781.70]
MSKLIAIVAGVGPGTGAAVARRFATAYPVVLLSRNASSFNFLVDEINGNGGKAIGIPTDVSDAASVKNAIDSIHKEFGADVAAAAAVFNAAGGFIRKPFLELTEEEFSRGITVSGKGSFVFSQATLPLLLKGVDAGSKYPPTLIFTGATASLRGSAQLSAFATGEFAKRALAQSLGREFGPKGVHVANAIIDGVIDIEKTKEWLKDAGPDAKIKADAIAEAYWSLHTQHRSALTHEIDIRPFVEKW